ncbi:MAG: 4-hydroxythreonine-4-phosphate dehydrogenase PdxA [Bacteroidetes bacterium]|nr:MAG: 4-hydroxythreonine-4-phosphate dehydrogenase PdxA [Bacteroidota bacterium]TAE72774.1 MAG: 4-hydroxythreonine-4-phosphate dehydrogenase PdxA [Bacteroidota bacterium]TAF94708.1 MAG: 4-hydroxythreonine-4-phosphate dehydrogenase PdxA [Bacteroidota bacterium]
MQQVLNKPIIGITCGDVNGIGIEIIIKALSNAAVLQMCTPVIFASNKVINFYRKMVGDVQFSFTPIKDLERLQPGQINLLNCWEDEVTITPGELNDVGGKYALLSLQKGVEALHEGGIDALVTAPIHKKNIFSDEFPYTGHTPFLKAYFGAPDVAMFMVADNMRVGLLTEHVPVNEIAKHITVDAIVSKLRILNESLQQDFAIPKPKIAVLGLNPHAGDEGLIGEEEQQIIKPAIQKVKDKILAFGPYSSDAFFARGMYQQFDAVLALYHDQGLIPFKSMATGTSMNYTAGLTAVRTSPDHGTAFDIAGKNMADEQPFLMALFGAIDVARNRSDYFNDRKNPLRKMSAKVLANAVDERIDE